MKLIKKNVGIYVSQKHKYKTSLFFCPVCEKIVERQTASGKNSKACSKECSTKLGRNIYKPNLCSECAIDNCAWLLKGKRVKGWQAVKIPYPGTGKYTHTYKIAYCPKFKKA